MSALIQQSFAKDPLGTYNALEMELCERSFKDFVPAAWAQLEPGTVFRAGWALDAISDHLQAVTEGGIRRLLINVPPGCTKSMLTSVFWPAWEWGPRGLIGNRYIGTSYALDLAIRDNMRCRDLMKSEWFANRWHIDWKLDADGKSYYENNNAGWRKAASSGAQLTGFRGDRIIVDDPHSVQSAESERKRETTLMWFSETLPTRLNDQDESVIVVIMQRLHERDVSGLIIAAELGYTHLMLPMEFEEDRKCTTYIQGKKFFEDPRKKDGDLLWPERFSRDNVEELKQTFRSQGGTYAEAGQLQQRPVPRGGGMFKKDWLSIVDSIPGKIEAEARGWDFAATADAGAFTVGLKMTRLKDGRFIITDVCRGQWSPHDVDLNIKRSAEGDGHNCPQDMPQDPGQAGKAQKAAISRLLAGHVFHFSPETGSKEDRAKPLASQAEAGNVLLLKGAWNDAFINEATLFPNGVFKDQVDAASRAFARLMKVRKKTVAGPVEVRIGG